MNNKYPYVFFLETSRSARRVEIYHFSLQFNNIIYIIQYNILYTLHQHVVLFIRMHAFGIRSMRLYAPFHTSHTNWHVHSIGVG